MGLLVRSKAYVRGNLSSPTSAEVSGEMDKALERPWFVSSKQSGLWHVAYSIGPARIACGSRIKVQGAQLEVPEGQRICSKCLLKMAKALGGQYRIVNVGD